MRERESRNIVFLFLQDGKVYQANEMEVRNDSVYVLSPSNYTRRVSFVL